jgi:SAM-dependent methyltransferase
VRGAWANGRKRSRGAGTGRRVAVNRDPRRPSGRTPGPASARERFRGLDAYRVGREWQRYEGTAQRDLFRELRVRFLGRHAAPGGWVVDVGSGPGRFLPFLGSSTSRRLALDLSLEALREVRRRGGDSADLVRGDGLFPPLVRGKFEEVSALGNAVGFAGENAAGLLSQLDALIAPGGTLVIEVVAGPGERSRYLSRLPVGALVRLLRSPVLAVVVRAEREGFAPEPRRHRGSTFQRMDPFRLEERYRTMGWDVREVLAVAPGLGAAPDAAAAVRRDPKAWSHLLALEEALGREPERWRRAAALLLAVSRPGGPARTTK